MSSSSRNRRTTLSSIPEPSGRSQSSRRKSMAFGTPVDADDAPSPASSQRPPTGTKTNNGNRPPVPGPNGRRKSMIPRPGRENAPPLPPKHMETKHMEPSSNAVLSPSASSQVSRRSRMSIGSKGMGGSSQSRDIRPISDLKFREKCVDDLLKFLQANNFSIKINKRVLAQPASADVISITNFMFRLVDPDFQRRNEMTYEAEVDQGFRMIGYPYSISRTSFTAASDKTVWPKVLAALHWLGNHLRVHLEDEPIEYLYTKDPLFENFEELHENTEKAFWQYLKLSFKAFMSKHPNLEQLEKALYLRFDCDEQIVSGQINRLSDENADILQEIEQLKEAGQELDDIRGKHDDWNHKIEEIRAVVLKLHDYRKQYEEKEQQDRLDLQKTVTDLENSKKQLEELEKAISVQKYSVEEIQKVELMSKGHLEAHERYEESLTEQKSKLLTTTADLDQIIAELEAAVDKYNSSSAPFLHLAENQSLQLRFNPAMISSNNEESIFGLDLAHVAKKTLMSMNSNADTDLNAIKSSRESMLDELTEKNIGLKQAHAKVAALKTHIKNTQKLIKASQERDEIRKNEMNALEEETLQGLERAAALERDATSLEAKMRRASDDHSLAVAAKQREMEAAAEQMEKHLAYMSFVVNDVQAHNAAAEEKVRTLAPHRVG